METNPVQARAWPSSWEPGAESPEEYLFGCRRARVAIARLVMAGSPRSTGADGGHIRALAEAGDDVPPVIVHRQTMRIIDGEHRVRAAMLRRASVVDALLFDGNDDDAFVLAVRMNVKHGLPLSRADRMAAANRILHDRPEWSDRRIASTAGLSPKTVGALRRRSTEDGSQSNIRIGRDERPRPSDPSRGRLLAVEVLAARPEATVREIAREAGIAVSTAQDVRQRIRAGLDPLPTRYGGRDAEFGLSQVDGANGSKSPAALDFAMGRLQRDPSLRSSEEGRTLIRLLVHGRSALADTKKLVDAVPPRWRGALAEVADAYARGWEVVAGELRAMDR